MDAIDMSGGKPANFLDVGGGVTEKTVDCWDGNMAAVPSALSHPPPPTLSLPNPPQVEAAFKILTSDKGVKGILINVFGGVVRTDTIARGIVEATKSVKLEVPLTVRLEGLCRACSVLLFLHHLTVMPPPLPPILPRHKCGGGQAHPGRVWAPHPDGLGSAGCRRQGCQGRAVIESC